jgi:hypothetical protein
LKINGKIIEFLDFSAFKIKTTPPKTRTPPKMNIIDTRQTPTKKTKEEICLEIENLKSLLVKMDIKITDLPPSIIAYPPIPRVPNSQLTSEELMVRLVTEHFGLNQEFIDTMMKYNGIIAGGASLAAYTNNIDNFTGDLDIWFQIEHPFSNPDITGNGYNDVVSHWISNPDYEEFDNLNAKTNEHLYKNGKSSNYNLTDYFLRRSHIQDMSIDTLYARSTIRDCMDIILRNQCGYYKEQKDVDKQNRSSITPTDNRAYLDNRRFKEIVHKIYAFEKNGKKIQIIFTHLDPISILKTFDLSFCGTSWNGKEFYALEPELTKQKIGYRLNDSSNDREEKRAIKYQKLGFTIYEYKSDIINNLPINPMNSLISNTFNINYNSLNYLLIKYNAVISGGSALAAYINEIKTFPKTGDIDIWIPITKYEDLIKIPGTNIIDRTIDGNNTHIKIRNDFETLLMKTKYYPTNTFDRNKEYMSNTRVGNLIYKLYEYSCGSNSFIVRRVQLIFTSGTITDILNNFDFSFCATTWNGKEFYSLEPELTKQKIGYRINESNNNKEAERTNKYIDRGFKIYSNKEDINV